MKLRIQDNSLRLRLSQKEVARLHRDGLVECAIGFPSGRTLRYSVSSSPDATAVSAGYEDDSLRVVLPRTVTNAWAESDQVTIEGVDASVRILVEKDFQCLHKEHLDPDGFPNPLSQAVQNQKCR